VRVWRLGHILEERRAHKCWRKLKLGGGALVRDKGVRA
jgi:hypothetical protein